MNVRFGNLTVKQFEEKTEVTFSDEDRKWLEEHRINSANDDNPDRFHIFDMPLGIYSGFNVYPELVKRLRKYDFVRSFTVEQKEADTEPTS